jgi:hypothetical protein
MRVLVDRSFEPQDLIDGLWDLVKDAVKECGFRNRDKVSHMLVHPDLENKIFLALQKGDPIGQLAKVTYQSSKAPYYRLVLNGEIPLIASHVLEVEQLEEERTAESAGERARWRSTWLVEVV